MLTRLIATVALVCASLPGHGQTWPTKPVRIVVPYSAGGTTDFVARQVAQKLSESTGKSFFVENKPGASGTIGTMQVARAAPDGYTLLANDTTYTMLPSLFKTLPWDHAHDFVPVTTIAQTPVIIIVPAGSRFKDLQQLIAFAKQNPGKLNFGSGGAGSSTHLAAEVFEKSSGTALTHIPYKGAGEALMGLIAGNVDLLITATPTAIPQIKGGKARALAVTGGSRVPTLPDVPTFAEAGLKDYKVTNWFGLAAPKGTPPDLVKKLQSEVQKGVQSADIMERLASMGAQPGGIPSADFAKLIKQDTVTWTQVAKAANVKPE
ncbi:tripartite tricarboxylate transporter substrate binding protein (plasmid) [Cupriavidus sp. KK10]|jgi:tripartite-type tricarboxylate transporter receptor subunit TctC|uniref:Bug family tripartite tricarboxylate transporter substrate binding protein n=1 Tax=Cupriavidus sp. KK10 TaxID=1478019 RepID=UPI001BAC7884|nr:tripartite tricarboxylate transporter substrate binding protein [Cupriavidus sp. KK10]QUN32130.1 tripartite tricarboxylate transporter substrate binding protein [Cupriavidus sp. KK10]